MKWPWVSRARLEAAEYDNEGFWEGVARRAQCEVDTERKRFDALLEKYHALAAPPPAVSDSTGHADLAPRPPSVVAATIKAESGGDPRLAAHLRKRATELKREGKTDEEIAHQLGTWQTTEEETAA